MFAVTTVACSCSCVLLYNSFLQAWSTCVAMGNSSVKLSYTLVNVHVDVSLFCASLMQRSEIVGSWTSGEVGILEIDHFNYVNYGKSL